MKMTFRWYGSQSDPIPLKYIKQIPGMTGLMGLLEKPAGVDWPEDEFAALKKEVNEAGLEIEVIESVNVHEDIKTGLGRRDEYIANYISTIRMLARHGVKVIIYNFMPVFDWLRTDLARVIPEDGSNSLYFDEKDLGDMGPLEIVRRTAAGSKGFSLPGWEPERLALLETTLKQYEGMTPDGLRKNFKYFPRQYPVPVHRLPGLQSGQRYSGRDPPLRQNGPDRRHARPERQVPGLPSFPGGVPPVLHRRPGRLRDHEGHS